jgi:hypothetical protein
LSIVQRVKLTEKEMNKKMSWKERGRRTRQRIEIHTESIIELCTKRDRIKTYVNDGKNIKEKT